MGAKAVEILFLAAGNKTLSENFDPTRKDKSETFILGFLTNFGMGGRGPEIAKCDTGLYNIDHEIFGSGGFISAF